MSALAVDFYSHVSISAATLARYTLHTYPVSIPNTGGLVPAVHSQDLTTFTDVSILPVSSDLVTHDLA